MSQIDRHNQLSLAAKTDYFLIASINTSGGLDLDYRGDLSTTVLRAVCAYL